MLYTIAELHIFKQKSADAILVTWIATMLKMTPCIQQTYQEGSSGSGIGTNLPSNKRKRISKTIYVPHRNKPANIVSRRNARERRRVQAVNNAFKTLRSYIPYENRNKRLSKVKTLQKAIDYIHHLQVQKPESLTFFLKYVTSFWKTLGLFQLKTKGAWWLDRKKGSKTRVVHTQKLFSLLELNTT